MIDKKNTVEMIDFMADDPSQEALPFELEGFALQILGPDLYANGAIDRFGDFGT